MQLLYALNAYVKKKRPDQMEGPVKGGPNAHCACFIQRKLYPGMQDRMAPITLTPGGNVTLDVEMFVNQLPAPTP